MILIRENSFYIALEKKVIINKKLCLINTQKKGLPFLASLFLYGALGRIRTFDRSVRSRVLYPAELRVRISCLASYMLT